LFYFTSRYVVFIRRKIVHTNWVEIHSLTHSLTLHHIHTHTHTHTHTPHIRFYLLSLLSLSLRLFGVSLVPALFHFPSFFNLTATFSAQHNTTQHTLWTRK
jgi:hypothetical protein